MFAVPGWSISPATLKTQTTAVKTSDSTVDAQPINEQDSGEKRSKKRKRDHGKKKNVEVTGENLGELWVKYFEEKEPGPEGRKGEVGEAKKKKKKEKKHTGEQVNGVDGSSVHTKPSQNGLEQDPRERSPLHEQRNEVPTKDGEIAELNNAIANQGIPEDDEGRAKYERRKAKAERKREQRAQKEANGELPPRREARVEDSTSQPKSKRPEKANKTSASPTAIQSDDRDVARAPSPSTTYPTTKSTTDPTPSTMITTTATPTPTTKLTPLQAKMAAKLTSARFRHLNETLYTTPSSASLSLFTANPAAYTAYHAGFRAQVAIWPSNPVDSFIEDVKIRGAVKSGGRGRDGRGSQAKAFRAQKRKGSGGDKAKDHNPGNEVQPLPRTNSTCHIIDLGCGDAALARTLSPFSSPKHLNLSITSIDFSPGTHSSAHLITVGDITNLRPLGIADGSVDVAICCLSLMNTNWVGVVGECARCVRQGGGEVWVAEIRSRFGRRGGGKEKKMEEGKGRKKGGKGGRAEEEDDDDDGVGLTVEEEDTKANDETDVSAFVEVWERRGFRLMGGVDLGNKMFVKMRFVRERGGANGVGEGGGGGERFATSRAKMAARGGQTKFIEREGNGEGEGRDEIDEGRVLKPCVYKTR